MKSRPSAAAAFPTSASRRRFLRLSTLAAAAGAGLGGGFPARAAAEGGGAAALFDAAMEAHLKRCGTPGGSLAVVKDGRLVHAKGYGLADKGAGVKADADTLFRIASVSKPVTAVAVLQLVEQGKLRLDTPVKDLLTIEPFLEEGTKIDERLTRVTVRHLLHHTAGWDRDKSGDPMFMSKMIAEKTGAKAPAEPAAILRYMAGRPLDFDPGERYAYSNLGYCALGRILEKLTGKPYEEYIKETVLTPAGISRMRIGATRPGERADGESRYYLPGDETCESVFPDETAPVEWPYGGFYLEAMDAHGAWIASAVDLARFAAALSPGAKKPLLKPETVALMEEPPPAPASRKPDGSTTARYYGCGWSVQPTPDRPGRNRAHNGSLPGTWAVLVTRDDGVTFAALFNQRVGDKRDGVAEQDLHRAVNAVTEWPAVDLFS